MFSWSTVVHNNKYWLAKFEEKNELKGAFWEFLKIQVFKWYTQDFVEVKEVKNRELCSLS